MQEMQVQSLCWENLLEKGSGNPLQYSCLGNPMDRGAWWAKVRGLKRVRHNLATKPPHPRDSRMDFVCSIQHSKRMPAGWLKITCTWVCAWHSVIGKA